MEMTFRKNSEEFFRIVDTLKNKGIIMNKIS